MEEKGYIRGFLPYGAAALLVGLVGGFSAVLGPAFVSDLGLAYNNTTWTALATAMSSAACAPILGKLADVLGRRRTLLLGVLIYTLGNVLTALAPGLIFMLLARFILGIGAAAVAPVVISYILTEFPPEKIAKGFSVYMLVSSGAVVIGPTAGSWIIDIWGWRAMMWLCSILCGAVFVYCLLKREKNVARLDAMAGFDVSGAVLVVVFFSLLLCIPSFGQNLGWDSWAFRLVFLAAIASLFGLIQVEKKAEQRLFPQIEEAQRQQHPLSTVIRGQETEMIQHKDRQGRQRCQKTKLFSSGKGVCGPKHQQSNEQGKKHIPLGEIALITAEQTKGNLGQQGKESHAQCVAQAVGAVLVAVDQQKDIKGKCEPADPAQRGERREEISDVIQQHAAAGNDPQAKG